MTKRQVTRRCHWVAQSYLKTFACDEGRQRIWRFSKDDGEPELKRIDKVAVKFHLYAPTGVNGSRDDALERKLAELESWFGEPLWKAVCNDFPDFSWEPLRKMVALLAAVTWLRTPRQFEWWKILHSEFVDQFSQSETLPNSVTMNGRRIELDHSDWPEFRDADEEDMKRAWNAWVAGSADIAKAFIKMRWAIICSDAPVFITSDNPVMVGDTIGPHLGLSHPDMSVTFPLSPTRVLVMDNRHDEPDAQFYPLKHDPASINILTWRNSMEYMFSPRHPDEICAEIVADAERMGYT